MKQLIVSAHEHFRIEPLMSVSFDRINLKKLNMNETISNYESRFQFVSAVHQSSRNPLLKKKKLLFGSKIACFNNF